MIGRRRFLTGALATLAAPALIRPARARVIPPTIDTTIDAYTQRIVWPTINGGDTLQGVQVWAWPKQTWQLTGWAQGGNISNPDVPVSPGRGIEIHGTLDGTCFGLVRTIMADPAGMATRMYDPVVDASDDPRFFWTLPVVIGPVNAAGGDCSLILFLAKPFGTRP